MILTDIIIQVYIGITGQYLGFFIRNAFYSREVLLVGVGVNTIRLLVQDVQLQGSVAGRRLAFQRFVAGGGGGVSQN